MLSATNHGEIPAAILRPYVTPMNHWMLYNHEVFQAYFFLDKCGGDKDLRDKVKEYKDAGIAAGHPYYEACAKFCLEYDQMAFDPHYDTDSLESFVPLVEEVLGRKPYWWEPEGKKEEELDCKARLCFGYSLTARDDTDTVAATEETEETPRERARRARREWRPTTPPPPPSLPLPPPGRREGTSADALTPTLPSQSPSAAL